MDTALSQLKIIIGMPAFNEEKYVGSIVLQARQYAQEVLVVDDGSADRTAKVAGLAGAEAVSHVQNRGYGAAVKTLFDEARKRRADILVVLDADAQHNPDQIPLFIQAIKGGNDVALGSRQAETANIPAYRRAGQKVLSSMTRVLSKSDITDTECGFRAYSQKALELLHPRENGMAISAEIVSEATLKGLRIVEIPVSAIYTRDGSTLNPVKHGVGNFERILTMISERRPLLFFGSAGCLLLALGLGAGIMVAKNYYTSYILATGSALLTMLLVTIGILSISTGIILDVLVRRVGENPAGRDNSRKDQAEVR